jgi:hypothetical protein
MIIESSQKTNWFRLIIVIGFTGIALFTIGQAFAEPLVAWKTFNEVHAAELKELGE